MKVDVQRHVQEVADQGYTIVERAISPRLIKELNTSLERLERFMEVKPSPNSFEGHHTLRIYNLLAYDKAWQRVPVHEHVLPIIDSVLDPGCLISSLSSINIMSGEAAQPIHADDQLIPLPKPHPPTVCNSMWALTDFTEANGATRLIPGSHLRDHSPDYGSFYDSIPAEMETGSVLIWHGSLWHGGGANRTRSNRIGIAMNYCAGYIRQQENQLLGLTPAKVRTFEPRLRELVGYGIYNFLIGHINKHSPEELILGNADSKMVWDQIQMLEDATPMLVVTDDARIRVIRFNRPDALNAFNDELYHFAGRALTEASERDDIACVILTGTGRAFSAGQDLGEMGRLGPSAQASDFGADGPGFPRFLDTLAALDKPVIAAVNGIGVGIGMTMLLHVDAAFIATTARLRAPFVPLGVVPEAAGSLLMPVVMGNQRAAVKLYTGEWITADEAVEYGLVLRAVPPEELMDAAMDLARRIARMPVASLRATKQMVVDSRIDAVRAARAREDNQFRKMIGQPANMEAITAFLEKREPDFTKL